MDAYYTSRALPLRWPQGPPRTCIDLLNARYGIVPPARSAFTPPDPVVVAAELALLSEGIPAAAHPRVNGEFVELADLCRRVLDLRGASS